MTVSYDEQYLYLDRFRWDEEKVSYTAIISIVRDTGGDAEGSSDDNVYDRDMGYEITYIDHEGVQRSRHFHISEHNIVLWNKVKATILKNNASVVITE